MLNHNRAAVAARKSHAPLFAALGDETRLALIAQLSGGDRRSISQLADRASVTRQAITKHLRVLEKAGVVRSTRAGRESLFELKPKRLDEACTYLVQVAAQWNAALVRLKAFVEEAP